MADYKSRNFENWKNYVTPKLLRETPIHRWLVFPHSFSSELVQDISSLWGLGGQDIVLDPFVGAGTTLVAAKKLGISASGFDISPFAVFASNVKIRDYDFSSLATDWSIVKENIDQKYCEVKKKYNNLIKKAFNPCILAMIEHLDDLISTFSSNNDSKAFFRLALLKVIPKFSRAKASGGWLKWVDEDYDIANLIPILDKQVELMIEDVKNDYSSKNNISVNLGDARFLPRPVEKFTSIITSPPYPNRHDYTRIFGIELLYGFLNWEEAKKIRYQSIQSHPESKPIRPKHDNYVKPEMLCKSLNKIKKECKDKRLLRMLEGYFVDLFCCFKKMSEVCIKHANIAIVIGNAQYYGELLRVDEMAACIGEQVGLKCKNIVTARLRGNSAQQMKIFGRNPSRESVIFFKNN